MIDKTLEAFERILGNSKYWQKKIFALGWLHDEDYFVYDALLAMADD